LLLCTDGIHGRLDHAALTSLLTKAATAADGAATLVNEAITRGTTDNATALVITVS
jgi:serine/threonine protein phosphatase PrpC